MRRIIPYDPKLKERARKLRNHSSLPEILLWKRLSKRQLCGYDFHRQKPLLNFIADFYCHELDLVIEVDGKHHNNEAQAEYDFNRDSQLQSAGLYVYRIPAKEILTDIDLTVENIRKLILSIENGVK